MNAWRSEERFLDVTLGCEGVNWGREKKKKHTGWKCDEKGEGHEESMECDERRVTCDAGIVILYVYGPVRWGSGKMPLEDLGLVDLGRGKTRVHVHVWIVADMDESRGGKCG